MARRAQGTASQSKARFLANWVIEAAAGVRISLCCCFDEASFDSDVAVAAG
jgi:hypothetical protein